MIKLFAEIHGSIQTTEDHYVPSMYIETFNVNCPGLENLVKRHGSLLKIVDIKVKDDPTSNQN